MPAIKKTIIEVIIVQIEDKVYVEYLSTDNWLFSCLPRGEQLLENAGY
ncbi:MAG: hypothetical protein AB7V37_10705 [Eubacteriaceae bacterium]|jgi:hypothetical protein